MILVCFFCLTSRSTIFQSCWDRRLKCKSFYLVKQFICNAMLANSLSIAGMNQNLLNSI